MDQSESRSRKAFWMLCLQVTFFQMGFAMVSPILPLYAQSFGVSEAAIGWVLGIYGVARFLSNLPSAALSRRFGLKAIFTAGALLVAIGNFLCGWAPSFPLLLIFRCFAGAGAAITMLSGQILVANSSVGMSRARALAYYQGSALAGISLGPLPGGLLAEWFGLNAPFYVYGVLSALVAFGNLALQPDDKQKEPEGQPATRTSSGKSKNLAQFAGLMRDWAFLGGASVAFFQFFARTGGVHNLVPLIGANQLGLSPAQIGGVIFLIGIWNLMITLTSGTLADRFGERMVLIPAMLSGAVGLTIFATSGSYLSFQLAGLFWGASAGLSGSVTASYVASRVDDRHVGTALASYRTIADAGYIVGPVFMGAVAEAAGAGTALLIAATLLLLDTLFFAWSSGKHQAVKGKVSASIEQPGQE